MENELIEDGWEAWADDGFMQHVGGYWRRLREGRIEFAFIARDFHVNRNGQVHGGMLMTFVDRAFGQTARETSGAVRGATISLTHQFLTPMRIGEVATIAPRVAKLTPRMAFMEGTIHVGDTPILSASGVWRQSHSRPAEE